ncbi:MAG: hypothetical protein L3J71_12985 [Victivallaceae bacterium]|nr:hypothetical protein [Victivallaceae bacterium]
MGFMKLLGITVLGFWLCGVAVAGEKVAIGVYGQGHGVNSMISFLQRNDNYNVKLFKSITPENLKQYKVIVFNNSSQLMNKNDKRIVTVLMNFVHNGGGILFTHNAAAYRGMFSNPPFPWIGFSKARIEDRLVKGTESGVGAASSETHPIVRGWLKDFDHMYLDHISLIVGSRGTVVASDRYNQPVVIAGEPFDDSNGRVVMMGLMPALNSGDHDEEPVGLEGKLVNESVKWLMAGHAAKQVDLKKTSQLYARVRRKLIREHEKNAGQGINTAQLKKCNFDWKGIYMPGRYLPVMSRKAAEILCADMKRMGLNALILPGIGYGVANFPSSKILPESSVIKDSQIDYLKLICDAAAKQGVAVYGMVMPFNAGFAGNPSEFLREYPQLLQLTEHEYTTGVTSPYKVAVPALCPDNPVVRNRMIAAVGEMLRSYPQMAGISLDYIRYKDDKACFCKYSRTKRQEFMVAHPKLSSAAAKEKFSEHGIVSFVKELREALNKVRPGIKIHAYTHPTWANKFPLDIHSKRASAAVLSDTNFKTPEQCYYAALNLTRNARRYYKNTKAAPLADLAHGKPLKRFRNEIRVIGKAGADSITVWSYGNFSGLNQALPNIPAMKVLCEELNGTWQERAPVNPDELAPIIPARRNLIKNGYFAPDKSSNLTMNKVSYKQPGKIGKQCAILASGASIKTPLFKTAPGVDYAVSAYLKLSNPNDADKVYVRLYFFNKAKKSIYCRISRVLPVTRWQRVHITRYGPWSALSGKSTVYVGADIFSRASNNIEIDGFKLEKGMLPSQIKQ